MSQSPRLLGLSDTVSGLRTLHQQDVSGFAEPLVKDRDDKEPER